MTVTGNAGNIGLVNAPVQLPSDFNLTLNIGETLKDLCDRALVTIENTPSKIIRDAGQEVIYIITAMQDAYKQSLDQTIDRCDDSVKGWISYLDSVVRKMEERNYAALEQFSNNTTTRMQQLIASTVFAKNYPYLRSMSPECIVLAPQVNEFALEFFGYFPQVLEQEFFPKLELNGHFVTLSKNENQRVVFRVPAKAFKQDGISAGALTIPYSTPEGKSKTDLRYQFEVRTLPRTVGTITIEHTTTVSSRDTNTKVSDVFKLNSRKKYGGQNHTQVCGLSVTSGWKLLHGSYSVNWLKNKGKRNFTFLDANDSGVRYKAETFHDSRSDGSSGKLYFTISFTEYRDNSVRGLPKQIPLQLAWGESRVFNFLPKTWKIGFEPFDGAPRREFIGPSLDDPYLNISLESNGIHISTKDPLSIKLPPAMTRMKITHFEVPKAKL